MSILYVFFSLIILSILFVINIKVKKESVFLLGIALLGFLPFLRIGDDASTIHYIQTFLIFFILLYVSGKLFFDSLKGRNTLINIGIFKYEASLLLIFIVIFSVVGYIYNNELSNLLGQIIIFMEYILFYLLTLNAISKTDSEKVFDNFIKVYVILTAFSFIMVIIGVFPANTVENGQESRIVLGIPLFSWIISIYFINKFLLRNRIKYLFIAVIFAILLFISYFRSYWVGFVISILYLSLYNVIKIKRINFYKNFALLLVVIIVGVMFLSIYALFMQPDFIFYTLERVTSAIKLDDPSVLTRLEEVKTLTNLILEKPIFGYGLGAEYEVYSHGQAGFISKNYIHNIVLFLLYKTGIIGFSIILLLVLSIFYKVSKHTTGEKEALLPATILSILFGLIIAGFAEPEIINFLYTPYIGFFLGILSKAISNQEGIVK